MCFFIKVLLLLLRTFVITEQSKGCVRFDAIKLVADGTVQFPAFHQQR